MDAIEYRMVARQVPYAPRRQKALCWRCRVVAAARWLNGIRFKCRCTDWWERSGSDFLLFYAPPPLCSPGKTEPFDGVVYVLRCESGATKIGMSTDPVSRLRSLRAERRREVHRLLGTVHCQSPRRLEMALHQHFMHRRTDTGRGREWFDLDEEDTAFVLSLARLAEGDRLTTINRRACRKAVEAFRGCNAGKRKQRYERPFIVSAYECSSGTGLSLFHDIASGRYKGKTAEEVWHAELATGRARGWVTEVCA